MEFNKTIIGQRIYDNRKKKKMSRKLLGEKVNLHETTVKRYEDSDIKNLSIEKLEEFAKALDISLSELLGINNEYARNINYKLFENFESDKSFTEPLGINVDAFNSLSFEDKENFKILISEYNTPVTLKYNYYIENFNLLDQKTFSEFYEYINDYYNELINNLIENKYNKLKNLYLNIKSKSNSQEKMVNLLKEQLEISDQKIKILEDMLLNAAQKNGDIHSILNEEDKQNN